MSSYISSNANRFYTALESEYGQVAGITAGSRIPALKLAVRQQLEVTDRKDKTGSRTFPGVPPGGRLRTDFDLRTYMTSWAASAEQPSHGPLFQAALGGTPSGFGGGMVASCTAGGRVTLAADHGLSAGQAVTFGGELRFVNAVVDARTVQLNAPFTTSPPAGASLGATVTYMPATELPSVSVYDYWSPETAVQRLLRGAAVDQLKILVNGDFHEFQFSGFAQDVLDTSSFSGEAGTLESFPAEPALAGFDYSVVPGNMGQAWLGTMASQFFTITSAQIVVKNGLDARGREFGSRVPRAVAPGRRSVTADLEMYGLDDEATKGLYQAARQQSPMTVMFQLGEAAGQMVGVMLRSVVPVVPEFDDSENRLQWRFRGARAQGTVDDEVSVAFG